MEPGNISLFVCGGGNVKNHNSLEGQYKKHINFKEIQEILKV